MAKRYLEKRPSELFWSFWLLIPYLMWLYSIGIELNKKNIKSRKLNKWLLFGLIFYLHIYILTGLTLILVGKADMETLAPFHYGGIFCMFLLMILTSRTIRRFERSEGLKQSNGLALFFGIWYFIFGIWFIQPKLNEYVKRI